MPQRHQDTKIKANNRKKSSKARKDHKKKIFRQDLQDLHDYYYRKNILT